MKRKSLSQLFREVDPELTVIPGGSYRHGKRRKAIKLSEFSKPETPYKPHEINIDDWEKARGSICPECKLEVFRLYKDTCLQCSREKQRIKDINQLSRRAVSLSRQGKPLPDELLALGQVLQGAQ